VRLAIVSDVHGNLTALEAVIADLKRQAPDAVYHLGDLVANGARPAEVLERIQAEGWPGVYGNTDEMLWRPEILDELAARFPKRQDLRRVLISEIGPVTADLIAASGIAYLRSLPLTLRVESVLLCHASPADPWMCPRADATPDEFIHCYGGYGETVVYGHIHHPFIRDLGELTVINTGSLSLSYDGDWRASYLIIDTGRPAVIRRVEYDRDREEQILLSSSLPRKQWLAAILRSGLYIEPF
jgi:predicted phosphodiesterase